AGPTSNLTMRTLFSLLRACALSALLALPAFAADSKQNYDIPAGSADQTLQRFSEISGRETLFASDVVRGVHTSPVKGQFTASEALNRLLAGTDLVATVDEKTGAFAVRRTATPPEKNAPSRTEAVIPSTAESSGEVVKLSQFTVTGSRISRLEGE